MTVFRFLQSIPNKNAVKFLDWFNYSDNTIDGQSKKKAYTFLNSDLVSDEDVGTTKALQQIHAYIFGGLYDFAGKIRTKTISKGDFTFCVGQYLNEALGVPLTYIKNLYRYLCKLIFYNRI